MEEEEGNTEGFFFSSAASHPRGNLQVSDRKRRKHESQ